MLRKEGKVVFVTTSNPQTYNFLDQSGWKSAFTASK